MNPKDFSIPVRAGRRFVDRRAVGRFASVLALSSVVAVAAGAVEIVGSSTVYPFSTVAAERFAQIVGGKAPKVESTGSGGGIKLFCAGDGEKTPSIANASRRMKKSEQAACAANGVDEIIEVKIGYDGIVIAQALAGESFVLSRKDVFLGLAKQIPGADGRWIDNPHQSWRDVNPTLPAVAIRVYGPPPTSGTRDAFAELVLEKGCSTFPVVKALKKEDKKRYKAACHGIREDGVYVESGENDNLIIRKLANDDGALGVFGFSFLEENRDRVRGLKVEEVTPSFEAIADGSYPVSRPLFFYVKKAHLGKAEGLADFIEFFVSEDVMGEEGFLVDRGLIPLPPEEYESMVSAVLEKRNMPRL